MRLVQHLKRQLEDGRQNLLRRHGQAAVLTLLVLVGACTFGCTCERGLIVEPAPGTVLADGIVLEHVSTREGDLEQVAFSPQTGQRYAEGRRCLIVSGRLHNTTNGTLDVDLWADGYSATGERVAATLISEAQEGYLHFDVPGEASREFELVLSWSSRVSRLQIRAAGEDVPIPPSYGEGQVLDIAIEPAPGAFLTGGIILEEASACIAALERTSFTIQTGRHHTKGDWCLLVTGRVRNTTSELLDVDMWVDGYNSEGERVASTLASATQEGYLHLDVPGETSRDFEISMNWSDELRRLEFTADLDDRMIPSPPMLPSSKIPEGLTVFPPAGDYLTMSSDGESTELLMLAVEIDQVESLEEYRYRTLDDKHTIQRGDPILVVRGIIQNRHRTYSEISMAAWGSDAAGNQVSVTLDSAHLPGCIGLEIPPGEIGEFTLHMNPADNLASIHIYGGTSPIPPP